MTVLLGKKVKLKVNVNDLEVKYRPKKNLILYVSDQTGQMQIRFLHYYPSQIKQLESAVLSDFMEKLGSNPIIKK